MTVLTLALKDEKMRKVEEYAKKEERTNEELVDDAIDFYLHEKFMDELNAHGRKYGITPEIIAGETKSAARGKMSDNVAIYVGKVVMFNVRGAIDLELTDGRVIHGRYPNDLSEKIRSIHIGDQLKCTVESDRVIELEPVGGA